MSPSRKASLTKAMAMIANTTIQTIGKRLFAVPSRQNLTLIDKFFLQQELHTQYVLGKDDCAAKFTH
ncbi:hypothetical protein RSal33209_0255 [Renibacterium salmoninarum ATCC 33209]|uniref:Uncharacterized protein n=1 Tax=Renibacterium salmoninarum (strain ATCC 33209 / DSM 20767 / JCM 11484 / NBRC 15589 / NCIMB 2235) TaxID=288705 RepID=A9WM22_RENSM|nr:hypothetical protein RSal33209_0255 [Renibacterium salmoninarum ATCC 33209]